MAVFISTKALAKIPDQFSSTYVPISRKVLRSNLRKDPFFANLAKQSQGAKELKNGDAGYEVNTLQVVLNVVRNIQTGEQQSLLIDGVFGPVTENALAAAQQVMGITETGILDSQTLLAMDNLLMENGVIYNITNGRTYNQGTEVGQRYEVSIVSINGEITIDPKPLPNQGNLVLPAVEDGTTPKDAYELLDLNSILVVDDRVKNPILSRNAYFVEQGLVPRRPSGLPPDVKPRTIKDGETLISIIHEEYLRDPLTMYKVQGDPTSGVLHEFTARSLSMDDKDYRIRFLANLIYYMNHDPGISYAIYRSSMAPVAVDYTDEHLDEVNLYDNDSLGLNYKRFVERMNDLDEDYEWNLYPSNYTVTYTGESYTFDAPFTLDVGKDLYLPSREFAEALFLHLNFRPKAGEMYEQKTDAEGNAFFDWISQTGFDTFIANVTSDISDVVERAMTIDIYTEAYSFFDNLYEWIIGQIDEIWPRSMGFLTGAGIHINRFYGGGISGDVHVWRKVTPKDQLVVQTMSKGELTVSVFAGKDLGKGVAGKASKVGSGNGKKKGAKISASASAAVEGSITLEVDQIHEFPITKENTALLAMMLPALRRANFAAGALVDILDFFEIVNIDPSDYLTNLTIGVEASVAGQVLINLGLDASDANNYAKNEDGNYTVKKGNSDALNVNNIGKFLKKLDLTFGASLAGHVGHSLEIVYEYKNLPNLYEFDARMPSSMTLQYEYFADVQAATHATANNFIKRFILGTLQLVGDFDLFSTFDLDAGMALVCGIKYDRNQPSENHIFADYVWQELGINDPNGNISRFMGAKVYTGDFSKPLEPASEAVWKLDILRLGELMRDNGILTPIATMNELFQVLGVLELKKRFAFLNYNISKLKQSNSTIFKGTWDSGIQLQQENFSGNTLKKLINLARLNVSIFSAVELGGAFSFAQVANAVRYLFYRAWFVFSEESFALAGEQTTYLIKKQAIDLAFQEREETLSNNATTAETHTFFDDLLNDAVYGIITLLEIQPDGSSTLTMASVASSLGAVLTYFDKEKDTTGKGVTPTEDKDAYFGPDFDNFWGRVIGALLIVNKVDLKLNSAVYADISAAFIGGLSRLAGYFKVGYFDEILVLDKGVFSLKGTDPTDPAYLLLNAIMAKITGSDTLPDYTSDTVAGGLIGRLLALQITNLKIDG